MSILTKPSNPISANTDVELQLNLSELLSLVESLSESSYWEDSSNWREVDFVFTNSQKQYQRVVFKVDQNETIVTYRFSEDCINGLFECSRITVFGNVNDSFRIKRSLYGSQFDVIIEDGVEEVIAIDLTSMSVPLNDTYSDGDILDFTLNFSGLVNVEGLQILTENSEPLLLEDGFSIVVEESRLVLTIGSNTRYANYYSGSSTSSVTYRYIVQADDQDLDGLEVVGLDLNGGDIVGVNGEDVNLILPDVDTSGIIISNTVPDTEQPTILNINVLDGTYTNTDEIVFTMTFSEPVSISGSPELVLDVGGTPKVASLVSSSSTEAVFSYTIGSTDNDANGISIISLDNGVIQDAALNLLDRTLPITDTSNVVVFNDVTAPTIVSVTPPTNGTYVTGQQLDFTITFSETVNVTGIPFLQLLIGSSAKQVDYISGTGSSSLLFRYTVASGDEDTNGITFASNSVQIPSATIRDNSSNNAILTFTIPNTSGILVNSIPVWTSSINTIPGVVNNFIYNDISNRLFMSKMVVSGMILDLSNSPGLFTSTTDGNSFTSISSNGFISDVEIGSTGNMYSPLITSSFPFSFYQSLDQGVSFSSSSNNFTGKVVSDTVNNRVYLLNTSSISDPIGSVIIGSDVISSSTIPLKYSIPSDITSSSNINYIELDGNIMYIGTDTGLFKTDISTWTYFPPISFGGERYVADIIKVTSIPSYNVNKIKIIGSNIYVSCSNSSTYYLYFSNNNGSSFTSIALPDSSSFIDFEVSSYLYVSTSTSPSSSYLSKKPLGISGSFSPMPFSGSPYLLTKGNGHIYATNQTGTVVYKIEEV